MNGNKRFPSRKELDEAFHILQDQITCISVEEEEERARNDLIRKNSQD